MSIYRLATEGVQKQEQRTRLVVADVAPSATSSPEGGGGGGAPPPPNPVESLSKYIPTEVITLYIATLANAGNITKLFPGVTPIIIYWFFLCLTPVFFLLVYYGTLPSNSPINLNIRQLPWYKVVASTVAFAVWAFAVPNNPYVKTEMAGVAAAVAGLGAFFVSTILTYVERVLQRLGLIPS